MQEGGQMLKEMESYRLKMIQLQQEVNQGPSAELRKELITVRQENELLHNQFRKVSLDIVGLSSPTKFLGSGGALSPLKDSIFK